MATDNASIGAALDEIAELLEFQGANPFRVRAYRNAARIVGDLAPLAGGGTDAGATVHGLRGIGDDLAGKIAEIARTGTCPQLEELRAKVPPAILQLLRLPGIGARRAQGLRDALGIVTLEQLHQAAQQGRIRDVPGFGAKLEQRILDSVQAHLDKTTRHPLADAMRVAADLLAGLSAMRGVRQAVCAGSLRRRRETVGDIDLLATAAPGVQVTRRFAASRPVRSVLALGPTRSSVMLQGGMQVDLRVVEPGCLGAAWLYFTGSKAHDIALRRIAHDAGFKLNEYGLFRGRTLVVSQSEAGIYGALGLDWIAPELREDRGEIEAARAHALPALLERQRLLGDLHVHTRDGEGSEPLEALAEAARARGLAWMAVTDVAGEGAGIGADGLARQADRIDAFNAARPGFRLLKGVEVAIRADGKLALPDAVLGRLDVVVGAVRSQLDLSRQRQTARLLRAMERPCLDILAHPRGRGEDGTPRCDIDLEQVLRHARERGCHLELHGGRLDLDEQGCRQARDAGVRLAIGSGAHAAADFDRLDQAVFQARRGWLGDADVLNTRPAPDLLAMLRAARRAPADPVPA